MTEPEEHASSRVASGGRPQKRCRRSARWGPAFVADAARVPRTRTALGALAGRPFLFVSGDSAALSGQVSAMAPRKSPQPPWFPVAGATFLPTMYSVGEGFVWRRNSGAVRVVSRSSPSGLPPPHCDARLAAYPASASRAAFGITGETPDYFTQEWRSEPVTGWFQDIVLGSYLQHEVQTQCHAQCITTGADAWGGVV